MNSKTLISFCASNLYMGGVESYAFRMYEWAQENNCDFVFLIDSKKCFIEKSWEDRIIKNDIKILNLNLKQSEIKSYIKNYEKFICITPTLSNFASIAYFCKKKKIKASIALYILYYNFICVSSVCKIESLFNNFFTKKIADDTIFMDEQTLHYAKNIHPNNPINPNILRLGMKVNSNKNFENPKKNRILTVCRMNFPFKGYILGLLDDFSQLIVKYPELELKIIGDGEDSKQLIQKLENFPVEISSKIIYEKNVPYENLLEEFKKSLIYVGMGTTLLDASSTGCISIGAVANQTQNKSFGYFYDNPLTVGVCDDIDKYKCYNFFDLIDSLLQRKTSEINTLREKSIEIVNKYYSLDYVMKYFLNNQFVSYNKISTLRLRIICMFFCLSKNKLFLNVYRKVKNIIFSISNG